MRLFHLMQTNLPYVILKSAISIDGKIATADQESKWITGIEARTDVQRLRQEVDAVLTGVETIIQDDAGLIVKDSFNHQPIRVILDSTLRIPLHAKCLTDHRAETIICTSQDYDHQKVSTVDTKRSSSICHKRRTPDRSSGCVTPVEEALCDVSACRGRGSVSASFLEASLVNEAVIYMAPLLIGGKMHLLFEGEGVKKLKRRSVQRILNIVW